MPFKSLGLSDPLVQGILATGYTAPTQIQSEAIPAALKGRDLVGCAQTGTGKTAAFVLPLLYRLSQKPSGRKRAIKALVLTPTRELAVQIERSVQDYGRFLHMKTLTIYGGVNIQGQLNALRRGVDIVVATPGRLLDHMQRESINLTRIEVLVIDEADRMFDMGFIHDVRKIISAVPKRRQTLLFSATMPAEVKKLTESILNNPKKISIGKQNNPIELVTQHVYSVEKNQKIAMLLHMIQTEEMYSVLVFSRTKYGADKIARHLDKRGIKTVAIHSNRTQRQRLSALDGFRSGKYQVMVATDIAARGIDIDGISHVINYDIPSFAEDYIHRIGRTGRAAATGDAISFVSPEEKNYLQKIEKFIGKRFHIERCPGFDYSKAAPPKLKPPEKGQPRSQAGPAKKKSKHRKPYSPSGKPRRKHGTRQR
jgi:ATP-dependent RNA helicase RhlE